MAKQKKPCIYIEALPLTTAHISGIGHTLANIVEALCADSRITTTYDIVLFGPKSGEQRMRAWGFPCEYRAYPMHQRVVTALNLLGLLPPIDRWLGTGIYLFGNYVNYPITKKSYSITYVHDMSYLRYPEYVQPKVRHILKRFVPLWLRRTDHVVTVSEYAKEEILHFYHPDPQKITVVPNGINLDEFYPRNKTEIEQVKTTHGISGDYMLFLSNKEPRKNLQRLVEAYRLLPGQLRKQYALVIVGGGSWLNDGIRSAIDAARAAGENVIEPDAYVPDKDLPALISGASVLAHPALYEGFGLSPLQAMACNTPVLVAQTSSLPEVVGDAGLYVDPLKTAEIAEGLEKLLSDRTLKGKLVHKGLSRAKQFTWHRTVSLLGDLFDIAENKKYL